jgi:hypothetical protein
MHHPGRVEPDQTYWLTDMLALAGPATKWTKFGEEPLRWAQCRVGVQPK